MNWLEIANLLFDKSNALSPRGAHLHLDTAAWLRTWTLHQNQAADYGARYFARHQEWPPLDQEAACQLYFRCLFAIENCMNLGAKGSATKVGEQSTQAKLETLLVDNWLREGIDWAERRYSTKTSRRIHA